MSKYHENLDHGQFSEHYSIEKDGENYNGRCEQGSLPGVGYIVGIGKNYNGLDLLTSSIAGAC